MESLNLYFPLVGFPDDGSTLAMKRMSVCGLGGKGVLTRRGIGRVLQRRRGCMCRRIVRFFEAVAEADELDWSRLVNDFGRVRRLQEGHTVSMVEGRVVVVGPMGSGD